VTDLDANPFALRQVQGFDGLYVHAADVVACLRARAAQFGELADDGQGDELRRAAYQAVSDAFATHADQLDVAAIGCITADPAPWVVGK
jgi:hypothetical protein